MANSSPKLMTSTFSVVIPTYNRAGHIAATIKSFLDQDLGALEIIIVDDGSSDNTEEVVSEFDDSRIKYHRKINEERGVARNFGAMLSKGEYVTFFDSDDIVYPWYLSHAASNIQKLNKPECYSQHFEFRSSVPNPMPVKSNEPDVIRKINKELIRSNFLACNGVFLRRDIFDHFKFSSDRNLSGSEDWYLWLQLAANFPFYYSPITASCLVMHDSRGEANIISSKLIPRLDLLIEGIRTNAHIKEFDSKTYKKLLAATYFFASVTLADFSGCKWRSIRYMCTAIKYDFRTLFRHDFFVTKKKLLFKWKPRLRP